jgi:hypothetical protein
LNSFETEGFADAVRGILIVEGSQPLSAFVESQISVILEILPVSALEGMKSRRNSILFSHF